MFVSKMVEWARIGILCAGVAALALVACGNDGDEGSRGSSTPPPAEGSNPPPAEGSNPPPAEGSNPPPGTNSSSTCEGDWTLGKTFYTCPDCGLGQACDNKSAPKNCADGSWITFSDGDCRCVALCSSLGKQVGDACDRAGTWHCREIEATNANANAGKYCVPDQWNICQKAAGGSTGSADAGVPAGSADAGTPSGGSCKAQGASCTDNSECCSDWCSFDLCV